MSYYCLHVSCRVFNWQWTVLGTRVPSGHRGGVQEAHSAAREKAKRKLSPTNPVLRRWSFVSRVTIGSPRGRAFPGLRGLFPGDAAHGDGRGWPQLCHDTNLLGLSQQRCREGPTATSGPGSRLPWGFAPSALARGRGAALAAESERRDSAPRCRRGRLDCRMVAHGTGSGVPWCNG